jgi:hypothetical protein
LLAFDRKIRLMRFIRLIADGSLSVQVQMTSPYGRTARRR